MSKFANAVLVTGGTSGVGFFAAADIARQYPGHCVIVASRKDANDSARTINQSLHQSNVQFLPLDLGDLKNVRAFASTWQEKRLPPISTLILNAGLQFPSELHKTTNGFEATFGVNHIGHTLLFYLLQPHLTDEARIIVTSSGTHDPAQKTGGFPQPQFTTPEALAHPAGQALSLDGRIRYSTSKLCNVLFVQALAHRLEQLPNKKWTVAAFDPGLMPGTGLAREYNAILRFVWKTILPALIPLFRLVLPNIHRPEDSGASLAWIATNSTERIANGVYYEGRKQIKSSQESYDRGKQEDLWAWTAKTVATNDQERQQFETLK